MIRPNRSHASLGVALALGLSALAVAPGCEIIANFDRSKIDAGGQEEDAALYDAAFPDGSPATDANPASEAGPGEAGPGDAGDASLQSDAGTDATLADSGDASVPVDASGADATDAGGFDSSTTDATDANAPDAEDANGSDDGATE